MRCEYRAFLEPQAGPSRGSTAAAQSPSTHAPTAPCARARAAGGAPVFTPAHLAVVRVEAPPELNRTWTLDFMTDLLYDGRQFRTLNVLDEGNREGPAIQMGVSLPAARVIRVLENLIAWCDCIRFAWTMGPSLSRRCSRSGANTAASPSTTSSRRSGAERLHRALQPDVPHRSPRRPHLRDVRQRPGDRTHLAAHLYHAATARKPRTRAAAHLSPQAHSHPDDLTRNCHAECTGSRGEYSALPRTPHPEVTHTASLLRLGDCFQS
jgi:hypothetical protein